MKIVITGSNGFVGKHLYLFLKSNKEYQVATINREDSPRSFEIKLNNCDIIFHLAGVNRPKNENEYFSGNSLLTEALCKTLQKLDCKPILIYASTIQADRDNSYGRSKKMAEQEIEKWCVKSGAKAVIFRFKNMFGKWCRPNYNSVTATFCYNIARGLPITITNSDLELELIYIDEVIESMISVIHDQPKGLEYRNGPRSFKIKLGDLAKRIKQFQLSRKTLLLTDLSSDFNRYLYSTYLSYLEESDFAYLLKKRVDSRGSLAEFLKLKSGGQIFVSRTKPGITRGDHYHHTKTEKFLVLEGVAIISFRKINDNHILEYKVNGTDFQVVDIPPGYTHSIKNIGQTDLITLFWASEIFDADKPDTNLEYVQMFSN